MTHEAFMQAILADPDDEATRLVYADWLEDDGDAARASLIRAQCQAERLPPGRKRAALRKEADRIVEENPAWLEDFKKAKVGYAPVFRRGFLHGATIKAAVFARHARRLFKAVPTLRAVRFPEASNELSHLTGTPHLLRLHEVDLSRMCSCGYCRIADELAELFASPNVANLTRLSLAGDRIASPGAAQLAASSSLGKLRELDLSHNDMGDDAARALLGSPWMGQLRRLDIRHNPVGVRMKQALRQRFGAALVIS